jgi:hypothetical protein
MRHDVSDDLDAWVKRGRRLGRSAVSCPEQSHPAVKPDDGRIRPGIERRAWGETTGTKGVYKVPSGKYAAKIEVACKVYRLGTFDTEAEAAVAVAAKRRELAGKRKEAG